MKEKKMEQNHIALTTRKPKPTKEMEARVMEWEPNLSVLDGAVIESYAIHPSFSKVGIASLRIVDRDGNKYLLYPECKVLEIDTACSEMKLIMGISVEKRND